MTVHLIGPEPGPAPDLPGGRPRVAVVGTGPTGLYALAALLRSPRPLAVTLFEKQAEAGWGAPYAPALNDPMMLSNIASIEIPPVTETLVAWLERQDDAALARMGLPRAAIDERAFYPRLVLGAYFRDQLLRLRAHAQALGHEVEVCAGQEVVDVAPGPGGVTLALDGAERLRFDHAVLATGHTWEEQSEVRPGFFASPWPSAALRGVGDVPVGILGTSLSAIDALVTLATAKGAFLLDEAGRLRFHPTTPGFRATLMSRKGILPEADFYFPIPYADNVACTPEAVGALIASGRADLLDATFALFREELRLADPDYAGRIGLARLDADSFAEGYYAERTSRDPFAWAALNLAEARANSERERVVPWRYAILRMHEVVALIVPHLTAADLDRFDRGLKGVFVDDYATVPHQSIERLLALREAGRLDVLRLGPDYRIEERDPGARVVADGRAHDFPAFVVATGQTALGLDDLPFPSLRAAARPARTAPRWGEGAEGGEATPAIDLGGHFRPLGAGGGPAAPVHLLSLPFLLHLRPFSQGLTASEEMAEAAVAGLLAAVLPAADGVAADGVADGVADGEPARLLRA